QQVKQLQQLKAQREQLDMDAAVAECDAKLKVLEEYEVAQDGMSSYLKRSQRHV
ncbi:Regulator of ribonuclease activity B, partial [Dissostichus eleginoides]